MRKNKQGKPSRECWSFYNSIFHGGLGIERHYTKPLLLFFVLAMVSGVATIFLEMMKTLFLVFVVAFFLLLFIYPFLGIYCKKCGRKMKYFKSDDNFNCYKCPKGHVGYDPTINLGVG